MSNNFIKRTFCPCCESTSYNIIHSVQFLDKKIWTFLNDYYEGRISRDILQNENFNVAHCSKCNLYFQEYILNDTNMFLLYEKWISADKSLEKKNTADISMFQDYVFEIEGISKLLNKRPHEINVLEFGMGWGFWANLAKAYNYNVTGCEISRIRTEYAQQSGLSITKNIYQEASNSYDYIYSNQVFEHIPNPKETLHELRRILKQNGIIHIMVPNGWNMKRKLSHSDWKAKKDAIHPLEHINCFNRNSLKILANQANLSLHLPLYRPKLTGLVPFFRSHLRYIYDLGWSTQVYLAKT